MDVPLGNKATGFSHVTARETRGVLHHGTGILVKKTCRSRKLWVKDVSVAQAIAINVEGINLVNVYLNPKGVNPDFLQKLLEWLSNKVSWVPWLIMGDFNKTPDENDFVELLISENSFLLVKMIRVRLSPLAGKVHVVSITGSPAVLTCFHPRSLLALIPTKRLLSHLELPPTKQSFLMWLGLRPTFAGDAHHKLMRKHGVGLSCTTSLFPRYPAKSY